MDFPHDKRDGHLVSRFVFFRACKLFFCFLLILLFCGNGALGDSVAGLAKRSYGERDSFESSTSCTTCHQNIYDQFKESMHAKSFTNSLVKNMFFDILLKGYSEEKTLAREINDCIACHSPITYLKTDGNIFGEHGHNFSGVECDLCHRITGYKGEEPGGGNYIAEPGMQKLGPFQRKSNWHHVYAELQTRSEICAVCHNRVNRYGLEIMATYSEWKASRYAEEGIQCQDCHMNKDGFLTGGKPVFETGHASQNTLARSPLRSRLYTHRFPGAHSETQVKGAIRLDIAVDEESLVPGQETEIVVLVDNSKSGHKLPTGTAELRLAYLDAYAQIGDRIISLQAESQHPGKFDVSGMGKYDDDFLGEDFPNGRRLYRAICVNTDNKQTFYSYDAEKIIFDNRLEADEIRKERYTFRLPEDVGDEISFIANLYYLRYSDPIAERFDVERAKRVELAATRKDVEPAR